MSIISLSKSSNSLRGWYGLGNACKSPPRLQEPTKTVSALPRKPVTALPSSQQHATARINDADVTLFEVGRRLEYLPQRNEKKESQKANQNELPITAKGEEGKTERGQRQVAKEGRMARLTGKCKYDL
jgi:hypothetical protein